MDGQTDEEERVDDEQKNGDGCGDHGRPLVDVERADVHLDELQRLLIPVGLKREMI